MVRGIQQYIHGINLPWLNDRYSSDLGYNPNHPEWGNGYNQNDVDNYFEDIKNMNLNVVRFWLFEDLEGLTFDRHGFVSDVQPLFIKHLDHLVATANKHKLALYLTFFNNYRLNELFGKPLIGGTIIKNFIDDPEARQNVIDNAIIKIIKRYKYNPTIFAYDLINESNAGTDKGSYQWQPMRTFAKQVTEKIRRSAPDTQISMSTNWNEAFDKPYHAFAYGGLGLSFYDYHEYLHVPTLRHRNTTIADKPLLLGEYGLPEPGGDESAQASNAESYLVEARQQGWAGALSWMYNNGSTSANSNYRHINADGSWRPVAYTLAEFGAKLAKLTATISSNAIVTRGKTLTITADYRCEVNRFSRAIIELAIHTAQNTKIAQQRWNDQDFYPGEHTRYTWKWHIPPALSPGIYAITTTVYYNDNRLKTNSDKTKIVSIK